MNEKYKVSPGTIIRTAVLALALINQILAASGHSIIDIDNETMEAFINNGFAIVMAVITWWKNQSFTQAAMHGDEAKNDFKSAQKEEAEKK